MAYNTRAGPRLNASRTVSTGLSQTDGKGSDGIAQSSHHGHQQHTAPRTEASSQKRFGEYVYRQDFGDVNLPSDERFLADGPLDDADADMMYASYIYPNPNAGPTPASSTLRHAGSPSPGVPSLSPPSTAGPSSPSSSYSSLVSPSVAPPTPTYFNRRGSLSNQLLSSANIHEASPNQGHRRIQAFPSPSYTHQSSSTDRSWFAQQQAAFLHQQQQQEFNGTVPPSTPPRARTSSEGVRSSTTPRAMSTSLALYKPKSADPFAFAQRKHGVHRQGLLTRQPQRRRKTRRSLGPDLHPTCHRLSDQADAARSAITPPARRRQRARRSNAHRPRTAFYRSRIALHDVDLILRSALTCRLRSTVQLHEPSQSSLSPARAACQISVYRTCSPSDRTRWSSLRRRRRWNSCWVS